MNGKPANLFRTLDFERWANERIERTLYPLQQRLPVAGSRFAHIVGAQLVWLTRMRGEDSRHVPVWPDWTFDEAARRRAETHLELEAFLSGQSDEWWVQPVLYRNQSGHEFANTPEEIISHVTMHSQYHRGQITADIRDAGGEVLATDLIVYLREQGPADSA